MVNDFKLSSDEKYSFLPASLRNDIMNAGTRKSIFVEGYDDQAIFNILYGEEYFKFIRTGDCEEVKRSVEQCVIHLKDDKRFYGVIDRDLRMDEDVEKERNNLCYEGRLFIFFERYTLENYFIEPAVLAEFLCGKSAQYTDLRKLISDIYDRESLIAYVTSILNQIFQCLEKIGAANLTIRYFDKSKGFLESTISCDEVKDRIKHRLKNSSISERTIEMKFDFFLQFIKNSNSVQKFASAKAYFFILFSKKIEEITGVNNIKLNNHKSELARILKDLGLSGELMDLLNFIKN